jgi:hypothetical protein
LSDPAMAEMTNNWAKCMKASGYDYASPNDPMGQDWPNPRPSPDEVRTATDDAQCRDSVQYIQTITSIEFGYQSQIVEDNAPALAEIQAERATLLKTSQEIFHG